MNATRPAAAVFFGLACVLTFAVPEAVQTDALGDPGPVLLPRIVGICMGLLAILLYWQVPQAHEAEDEAFEKPLIVALSLLAIPLFYLLFQVAGYTLAVGLYMAAASYLLGYHDRDALLRYVLAATAFSLGSGMIFARLLDLPLPGVLP